MIFGHEVFFGCFAVLFFLLPCLRYYCLLCWWVPGLFVHCCLSCGVNVLRAACFPIAFCFVCVFLRVRTHDVLRSGGPAAGTVSGICYISIFVLPDCMRHVCCYPIAGTPLPCMALRSGFASSICRVAELVFVVHMTAVVRVCAALFPAWEFS